MPDYRLYLLTAGDRIDRAIVLTCEDDEQAIVEMALQTVAADGAELWQGSRRVLRIPPMESPSRWGQGRDRDWGGRLGRDGDGGSGPSGSAARARHCIRWIG